MADVDSGIIAPPSLSGTPFDPWQQPLAAAATGAGCRGPSKIRHIHTEKCQFETEKSQFETEKSQFETEKSQFAQPRVGRELLLIFARYTRPTPHHPLILP